jgi:hypothetical protein
LNQDIPTERAEAADSEEEEAKDAIKTIVNAPTQPRETR